MFLRFRVRGFRLNLINYFKRTMLETLGGSEMPPRHAVRSRGMAKAITSNPGDGDGLVHRFFCRKGLQLGLCQMRSTSGIHTNPLPLACRDQASPPSNCVQNL